MTQPPTNPEPAKVAATTDQWIYGGIRVLAGKRFHAWIGPDGCEGLYPCRPGGPWVIGAVYPALTTHAEDRTILSGEPLGTSTKLASDDLRRSLWVKDIAAEAHLVQQAWDCREGQPNAVDEALQPVVQALRTLRLTADRDAFIAYVLRCLLNAR